jgi:hypothetical protein
MCDAVPDCITTGYEELIDGLHLPDPDDRHVLGEAVRIWLSSVSTSRLSTTRSSTQRLSGDLVVGGLRIETVDDQIATSSVR